MSEKGRMSPHLPWKGSFMCVRNCCNKIRAVVACFQWFLSIAVSPSCVVVFHTFCFVFRFCHILCVFSSAARDAGERTYVLVERRDMGARAISAAHVALE